MFILILKIILLSAGVKLHSMKREPLYSALLYAVPLTLYALISGTAIYSVIIGSGILLALSFAYFWLLGSVPNGKPYYTVLCVGALIFLFAL